MLRDTVSTGPPCAMGPKLQVRYKNWSMASVAMLASRRLCVSYSTTVRHGLFNARQKSDVFVSLSLQRISHFDRYVGDMVQK